MTRNFRYIKALNIMTCAERTLWIFGQLLQYMFLEYVKRSLASFSIKIKTLLTCYFKSKIIEISWFSQTN